MRVIGWLLLILMSLGWLAAEVPLTAGRTADQVEADWRRTEDGWERPTWRGAVATIRRPALHPVVFGLLETLLASAALIAFCKDKNGKNAIRPPRSKPESAQFRRASKWGPYRFVTATKPAQPHRILTPNSANRP